MRVTYEVNLKVQKPIESDFKKWLLGHIREVLAIEGFESASWFQVKTDASVAEKETHWTVNYVLKDLSALESYLGKHASRMRQPAIDRFGKQFVAERRILHSLENFSRKTA